MSEETWRPLGVDTEEQIAEYDALHDGVPQWMHASFWVWVYDSITVIRRFSDGSGRIAMLNTDLFERMGHTLRISLPNLRVEGVSYDAGKRQLSRALEILQRHNSPLQIADYILAQKNNASDEKLNDLLERSKSAWEVGTRSGRPGLVRRVPLGVQVAANSIMARAGRAGVRLAKAWEELYSVDPNASEAYRIAILAVEDASIPVVSPNNRNATLGTVIKQLEDQRNWKLPMDREHPNAASGDVLVSMMRMLWHGQHDRHGGQPSAPGNVSIDEAKVAVSLAVTLVHWFDAALPSRST
ncbi:hypothetical protein AB0I72_25745 [Nocardiopsis sp. NPDC049922]|uniref:hypothetical protein n=1 Tax=Nocardiopsis sp. NPDC049922 TaxID=3155157 RepID=UPI0033D52760